MRAPAGGIAEGTERKVVSPVTELAHAVAAQRFAPGSLVTARGREWVVLPDSEPDMLVLRPLGGADDDVAAVFPDLEPVAQASFPPPDADDLGDAQAAGLLRTALRIGFRSSAGPFRSLAVYRRGTPALPAGAVADGHAPGHGPAGDLRRRGHRQDRRVRAHRRRAARPGGGEGTRRALPASPRRAVAGRAAHQVRHQRGAHPRLDRPAP